MDEIKLNQQTADAIKTMFFEKLGTEPKMADYPRRKAYEWLSEILKSLVSEDDIPEMTLKDYANPYETDNEITMCTVSEFCKATKPYNNVFSIGQLRNYLAQQKEEHD